MIEIKDCTCTYKAAPGHKALEDINLNVNDGEFVLLTGGSGCGKTTIIRLLNGLIPYFYEADVEGKIFVDGHDAGDMTIYDLSQSTGTVFQNPRAQFYTCDVRSELAFGCENQGLPEDEILARMEATVRKFSLEELADASMFALSGGQKQQVACASVDMENTPVILLDEPSANLDHEAIGRLKKLLTIWKSEGKTVIVSEHRIAYLWDLCDRVVILKDGRISHDLTGEEAEKLSEAEVRALGIRSFHDIDPFDCSLPEISKEDESLEFVGYSFHYKNSEKEFAADCVSMAKGEITALIGVNGAGKTTFLNCFCGLRKCKGIPRACPADRCSASRSPVPCPRTRTSFFWMSPPAGWTINT